MSPDGVLGTVYGNGEVIVWEGEKGDCLYVVQAGEVEVVRAGAGGEQRLAVLSAGELFGEMAVFQRQTRSATVRAVGEARVLRLDRKTLQRRLREDPLLAVELLKTLAYRLRDMNERLAAARNGDLPGGEAGACPAVSTGPAASVAPHEPEPMRLTPSFRPLQLEQRPPCQAGCPISGDVRGWIGIIAQREKTGLSPEEAYERAWRKLTDRNPFPAVTGRVCPHPCEDDCNRNALDEPVSINALERFLGDWALSHGLQLSRLESDAKPESIGVLGAGPSGLSFAYQLARRGYPVTVYEQAERAGGMLRYGIPDYRLPPQILDGEIGRIADLGVDLRLGTAAGRDVSLDELHERHAVLYLGIGAQGSRGLGVPGDDDPSVWNGAVYLRRVNSGEPPPVGRCAAVIGGGNTAVDAARTARRAGADVVLLYRRSREEMPALSSEIDEALEEGVQIRFLTAPVRIERRNGGPLTLTVQKMRLGEPDSSGRRTPLPVDGSEFELPVDTVIAAVSQEPDWSGLETLRNEGWLSADGGNTGADGLWAGGDVLGLGIVAMAVGHGRQAAETVHARLRGLPDPGPDERGQVAPEDVLLDYYPVQARAVPKRLSPAEALSRPEVEVEAALTEEQFLTEVSRCFSCGSCFGCVQCSMYCTSHCYSRLEEAQPGAYFSLSLDHCEECGKCVEVCPCGFLSLTAS